MERKVSFTHRFNPDGTYDSICRNCFRTVGHAKAERALVPEEGTHVCNMVDLLWIGQIREPSAESQWA
jgi:hypothetical protein